MFQFDGGTYAQTLARDGQGILQLDGNISHAVDFVAGIVRQEVAGLNSNADAIAWMNSVPVAQGNARFNQWTAILACRYNGRCGGTSGAQQAALYGNATVAALGEFGAGFWQVAAPAAGPHVLGGDVSGDRFADLLGIKPDGSLWYYRNSTVAGSPFSTASQVGAGWSSFALAVAADVNGDGFADVLATKPDGSLWYYRNAGAANPAAPYSSGTQVGAGWNSFDKVIAADVNGDHFADLLATRPDGTLWYYRNAGAANPAAPYSSGTLVGTGWNIYSKVFAADIDADAFADLVAMKPDGTLWHYHNAATANPSSPFSTGAQIGAGWSIYSGVFGADIDGDDYTDVVGFKPDGTMWLYRNSHNAGAPFSTGTLIGTGWNIY
jgi:hypothetical protein